MTIESKLVETQKAEVTEELIPVRDAAQVLSVHVNTIRRWNDRGIIKAYRIGNRGDRRFSLAEIRKLRMLMKSNSGNILADNHSEK